MYNTINWPEKCSNADANTDAVDEHNPYQKLEKSNNTQPQHNRKTNGRHCPHHKQTTQLNLDYMICNN